MTADRRFAQALVVSGVGLLLLVPGCGSSDPPDADASVDASLPEGCTGEIALEDAWDCALAHACAVYTPCFAGGLDGQQCREAAASLFGMDAREDRSRVLDAVAVGTLSYDGGALAQCLVDMQSMTCPDIFAGEKLDPFAACQPFTGMVPVAGACLLDAECATAGSVCDRSACPQDDSCCAGVCLAPATIGSACTERPCEPGAHCVSDSCTAGEVGDACTDHEQCDPGNWCDSGSGTCAVDVAANDACTTSAQCPAPQRCVGIGLPTGGVCSRSFEDGDPCHLRCDSFYSHYCDQPDPAVPGQCRSRFGAGATCIPEVMECRPGLTCESGQPVCHAFGQEGDSCAGSIDCAFYRGLYCTTEIAGGASGSCQGREADAAACADGDHCQSGYCLQGSCAAVPSCN